MVGSSKIIDGEARALNRARAREMRHAPVNAKFKRQVLIGPYIADFVCAERKLIVELDGVLHAHRGEYDMRRDELLQELGYRVLRIKNEQFADNIPAAMKRILLVLDAPSPRPSLPKGGEGGF